MTPPKSAGPTSLEAALTRALGATEGALRSNNARMARLADYCDQIAVRVRMEQARANRGINRLPSRLGPAPLRPA